MEWLRFALIGFGGPYVVMNGISKMPRWLADSWDFFMDVVSRTCISESEMCTAMLQLLQVPFMYALHIVAMGFDGDINKIHHMRQVRCGGQESRLTYCSHEDVGVNSCAAYSRNIAAVTCKGKCGIMISYLHSQS